MCACCNPEQTYIDSIDRFWVGEGRRVGVERGRFVNTLCKKRGALIQGGMIIGVQV